MNRGIKIALTLVMIVSIMGLGITGCAKEEAPSTTAPEEEEAAAPTSGKVYKWEYLQCLPPASSHVPRLEKMCQEITERSGGRLVVESVDLGVHPYTGGEFLSVVRDGLAEAANSEGVYVSGEAPIVGAIDLPFLVPTLDKAITIKDRWVSEILNDYLPGEWNQFMLECELITGESVHANTILNSWDALEGQKIRVWSKETAELVTTMGATPVTVAYKEVFSALDKGVIDGALSTVAGGTQLKWWDVVKSLTLWNFAFPSSFTVVNLDAYNELPDDLQDVLLEVGAEYEDWLQTEWVNETGRIIVEGLEAFNINVAGLSPEFTVEIRAKMKPAIWEPWVERCPGDLGQRFLEIAEEELAK